MLKKCIKPQAVIEYLQTVDIGLFLGIFKFKSALRIRIRIRWIRKILASWIRIPGAKYQPKTATKKITLKTQI